MLNTTPSNNEHSKRVYKASLLNLVLPLIRFIPVYIFASLINIYHLNMLVNLVGLAYIAYHIAYVLRVKVIVEDDGIWFYRGVFPWQGGWYMFPADQFVSAYFINDFFGYITKSYKVFFHSKRHDVSQTGLASLPRIKGGKELVTDCDNLFNKFN